MTRTFNPNEHQPDPDKGGGGQLEQAGDFLFVIKKITRSSSNSGKEYLLCRHVVIAGPQKGRSLLQRIYLNDEALWKLGHLCKAIGNEEAFDLDSDKSVREAIANRPFKARTSVRTEGKKRYTDVEMYIFEPTEQECAAMDEWSAEFAAGKAMDGDDDDPPPPSDSDYHGSSRGGRSGGRSGGGRARHDDDDIPF